MLDCNKAINKLLNAKLLLPEESGFIVGIIDKIGVSNTCSFIKSWSNDDSKSFISGYSYEDHITLSSEILNKIKEA